MGNIFKMNIFSFFLNKTHNFKSISGNVFVHCLMGVSRSVTIIVAYLITVTDMQLDKAHDFVRARRFFANPNFGFREQLKRYYKNVS